MYILRKKFLFFNLTFPMKFSERLEPAGILEKRREREIIEERRKYEEWLISFLQIFDILGKEEVSFQEMTMEMINLECDPREVYSALVSMEYNNLLEKRVDSDGICYYKKVKVVWH